jgi:hypothetical protein
MKRQRKFRVLSTPELLCVIAKREARRIGSYGWRPTQADLAQLRASTGDAIAYRTKLTGYLLRRHVDPFVTLELIRTFNATRCTPPLPDKDIERIVASVAGLELKRRQTGNG